MRRSLAAALALALLCLTAGCGGSVPWAPSGGTPTTTQTGQQTSWTVTVERVVDGETFNLALLEQGYARLYDASFGAREAFAAAEERARREGVGLWGFEARTTGAEGPLAVADIHADAAGDDHQNPNDEYVAFENTGGERLDLSGWQVRDAAGHTYTFPDGFALAAGGTVTLRTGSGPDSERDLYWGAESAIWNNGGDTVVVTDAEGAEVLRRRYG